MGEPSLCDWRKTASPSTKPPAQSRAHPTRASGTAPLGCPEDSCWRLAVGDWPTSLADQSPEDVPGPDDLRYFFFFAAFFFVAFFFAALFFAIPRSPPQ